MCPGALFVGRRWRQILDLCPSNGQCGPAKDVFRVGVPVAHAAGLIENDDAFPREIRDACFIMVTKRGGHRPPPRPPSTAAAMAPNSRSSETGLVNHALTPSESA